VHFYLPPLARLASLCCSVAIARRAFATLQLAVSFAPVTTWDAYDTAYTERYMKLANRSVGHPRRARDVYCVFCMLCYLFYFSESDALFFHAARNVVLPALCEQLAFSLVSPCVRVCSCSSEYSRLPSRRRALPERSVAIPRAPASLGARRA